MTAPTNEPGANPGTAAGANPTAADILARLTAAPAAPAQPAEGANGTQQPAAQAGTQTPAAQQGQQGANGVPAGSKEALLADLTGERSARQAAETAATEAKAKLTAVLTALGLGDATQQDPAQVAAAAQAAASESKRELAVVRLAPKGTDVVQLLDSRRFVDGLNGYKPDDAAGIGAYITKYLTDNPNAAGVRYAGGAGDVRTPGEPAAGPATMDDLLRGGRRQ